MSESPQTSRYSHAFSTNAMTDVTSEHAPRYICSCTIADGRQTEDTQIVHDIDPRQAYTGRKKRVGRPVLASLYGSLPHRLIRTPSLTH